ncbi:MAG: hypothetical protein V4564_07825 [Pseudomonadota bacterium]
MDRIVTVTVPAVSRDLTTTARVKLGLGITDTNSDTLLQDLVTGASGAAAKFCKRTLVSETVSERYRAYPFIDSASLTNNPSYLYLSRRPVTAITSVTEDNVVLVDGTDFEWDGETGKLIRLHSDRPLRWHFRKLTIVYTGGYTYPTMIQAVAPDIENAVVELVKDLWFSKGRDPLLKSIDQPSGIGRQEWWVGSTGQVGDWPQKFVDFLAPYVDGGF